MQSIRVLIIIILLSFWVLGCTGTSKKSDTQKVVITSVQVVSPMRGDVENYYTATGELEALKSVEVSSEITGKIARLNTDEGGRVTQGMVVAEIDDSRAEGAGFDELELPMAML